MDWKKTLDLSHLRSWGSAAYVHNISHKYRKLGPGGKKSIFIRYPNHLKEYVFIEETSNGNVIEIMSSDAKFLEKDFSF